MKATLPKYSIGNKAVGRDYVVSRAVGDTCSPSCPFLGKQCYARKTEYFHPQARASGQDNSRIHADAWQNLFKLVRRSGRALRLHERGDFGNGRLHSIDRDYVRSLERALKSDDTPLVWTYTHIYHPRLAQLKKVTIYASVHNGDDIRQATKAGFTRFALAISHVRAERAHTQYHKMPRYNGPQFVTLFGKNWVVCPKQYNAKGKPLLQCDTCGICQRGLHNVIFLLH